MIPYTAVSFENSVQLDSLLRHVLPLVPEIPHAMALDRVRQAYTEFARRSGLLVSKHIQDYQANVHDYALEAPDGYEVYMVLGLESPGYAFVDYWQGYSYGLWGTKFDVVDNTSIYIHRAPTVDRSDGLAVYISVLPTPCTHTIPQSIATPFGSGIAAKVIADLLRIPNKPWTNQGLAREYQMEYNRVCLAARHLSETNRRRGPLRAKPVRVV